MCKRLAAICILETILRQLLIVIKVYSLTHSFIDSFLVSANSVFKKTKERKKVALCFETAKNKVKISWLSTWEKDE